jgi:prepilin-type N-terminal cleavage/methylation domain-containing protein
MMFRLFSKFIQLVFVEIRCSVNRKQFFVSAPDSSRLSVTGKTRPQSTAGHSSFFLTESLSSNKWSNRHKILAMAKLQRRAGFTLIEVMLTMSLLAILAVLSSPFYGRFIFSQEAPVVSDELRGSFAKAQLYSMAGKNASQWGVAMNGGNIILFQGSSFASRNQNFDEIFPVHSRVTVSGLSEVVFARSTGRPESRPTITIAGNGATETLTMNSEGVLEEQ